MSAMIDEDGLYMEWIGGEDKLEEPEGDIEQFKRQRDLDDYFNTTTFGELA
jgi:hypothetical protein